MTPRARGSSTSAARVAGAARAASDIFSDIFSDFQLPTSDWDDSASDVSRVSRVSRWAAEAKAAETEARLADAESRALRAHAKASRSSPPEPSPREALFFAEARRAARDAFFFFRLARRGRPREGGAFGGTRAARARDRARARYGPARRAVRRARPPGVPVDARVARRRVDARFAGPFAGRVRVGPRDQHACRAAETRRGRRERKRKRRWLLAGVLPGEPGPSEPAALRSARLESGGAVARDRLRGCRVLREALSGAETRHVAHFCGAETVTCANETGGMYTDDGTDTEKSRNLSGRSLVSAEQKNVHEAAPSDAVSSATAEEALSKSASRNKIPTAAEAAAALGIADARAERVARLVTKRARASSPSATTTTRAPRFSSSTGSRSFRETARTARRVRRRSVSASANSSARRTC